MRTTGVVICLVFTLLASGCGAPARPVNQIEVWHWMTDRQEALEALAATYETQTGVKVKLELFAPSDAYIQKIVAAAQANVLPDIYGILDKRSVYASFIKAGLVTDLTADLQADNGAWQQSLVARALDANRFSEGNIYGVKPGVYGAPIDVTSIQLVYNRALLKRAGIIRPPATFNEFLMDITALKRVGIAPFVTGFGELWIVECFSFNYAFNIMGEQKVLDTFRGKVKYTDPDWIRVFMLYRTLRERGAFIDGIVTKGNKYAEQDFALGRAAFAFNGSWCVNVYRAMDPSLDYGVAPLPPVTATPIRSWGGAGSSFVVNDSSPNRDKAIAFIKWLTAKDQQVFLSEKTYNLPSNPEAMASLSPNMVAFAGALDNATHPSVWPVNEDPVVGEAFFKGIQSIIIGESSPESVARNVQKVKELQMKKAQP